MRKIHQLVAVAVLTVAASSAQGQDLAPRAYVVTPVHSNAATFSYTYASGDIIVGGSIPISGVTGTTHVSTVSYYHSLSLFGRSANVTVSLPYVVSTYRGEVVGSNVTAYRSGLTDVVGRLAINIKGAPAMNLDEFRAWRQDTVVGASIKIAAPTGQYDASKLINPGSNRWAFKPEIGVSRRWGHWLVDAYSAVWFFTKNNDFLSESRVGSLISNQWQKPVGAIEAHLSYDVRPRLWASLDANYWYGGRTIINSVESRASLQANSRIGGTCSIPLTQHQSVKLSYSHGARVRFGGNGNNVSVAWQYSWVGRRFGSLF